MGTRSPDRRPPLSRRARVLLRASVGLIVLLLVGPRLVDAYVDWLWFGEAGFRKGSLVDFSQRHKVRRNPC